MSSSERIKSYKNINKDEQQKKKRIESQIQLRKNKRNETLQKRRNIIDDDLSSPGKENAEPNHENLGSPEEMMRMICFDSEPSTQLEGVRKIRKSLSRNTNPPIQVFIKLGALPKLVSFLSWNHNTDMLFEACWAITNIASGNSDQTKQLVEHKVIEPLIRLLLCEERVADQAIWALGNIAGDSPEFRNLVLDCNILDSLLTLADKLFLNYQTNLHRIRNIAWTCTNLCRNRYPPTEMRYIEYILPLINKLMHIPDNQVVADALWGLSYVTDCPVDRVNRVIELNMHVILINMLASCESNTKELVLPALRSLGNIASGSDEQTQVIVDCNFAAALSLVVQKKFDVNNLNKELCWVISNLLAGSPAQIKKVIDCNLLPWVINQCNFADFRVRKEAVWALTNLINSGNASQTTLTLNSGGVEALCSMLDCPDATICETAMNGLHSLCSKESLRRTAVLKIEECGGLDKIEQLQQHENENVYQMSFCLIDRFFSDTSNDYDEINFEEPENFKF